MQPYEEYIPLAGLLVVLLAAAGIFHLRGGTTAVRLWMVQRRDAAGNAVQSLGRGGVVRVLGWGCFALALGVMIYPSWYCEYKPAGRGAFFGKESVRRSFVWSPPLCQQPPGTTATSESRNTASSEPRSSHTRRKPPCPTDVMEWLNTPPGACEPRVARKPPVQQQGPLYYGQPRIQLDTTILPVLILAGFGVGFLCLARQLSPHLPSSPPANGDVGGGA